MDLRASGGNLNNASILPRMPEPHELGAGALVRRTHPWDGSRRSGSPTGPELKVARFYDYAELSIVEFTDGTHAFAWTLAPVSAAPETLGSQSQSA